MFTGIVEEVGRVKAAGDGRLTVSASTVMDDLRVAGSISVNGACLTVTSLDEATFSVDVVPETLRRTNLGAVRPGDGVNLERPVPAGGRLDGHVVQGHVDGTGVVDSVKSDGTALMVRFAAPPDVMRYIVPKGFVAVDGTSLTVVDCDDSGFTVTVIPFTRDNTVLGARAAGDVVNLEIDVLAKYVERLTATPS